jgi:hypothetical protein
MRWGAAAFTARAFSAPQWPRESRASRAASCSGTVQGSHPGRAAGPETAVTPGANAGQGRSQLRMSRRFTSPMGATRAALNRVQARRPCTAAAGTGAVGTASRWRISALRRASTGAVFVPRQVVPRRAWTSSGWRTRTC